MITAKLLNAEDAKDAQPMKLWEQVCEPTPDGRWRASCPDLNLSLTADTSVGAAFGLALLIHKSTGN